MKVKSPKTGYLITVGGKTYKNLQKQGYFDGKIKSPVTNRYINVDGPTYNKLYNKGYFQSFSGIKDIDKEILLNLNLEDIKNISINQYNKNLMDDPFWCQWLEKHYQIKESKDCKDIAKTLTFKNANDIYDVGLKKGYVGLVKYLLDHKLVDINMYQIPHYHLEPINTAINNNHIDLVKLLLNYGADKYIALYIASDKNKIEIIKYLLENYTYGKEDLSEALQFATHNKDIDIINLLILYGANPESSVISAIHSDDINILKYILSFTNDIPNDAIAIALGLRKYDMLKLLLKYTDINIEINNNNIEDIEPLLLPYIQNKGLYYEVKYKWYIKNY